MRARVRMSLMAVALAAASACGGSSPTSPGGGSTPPPAGHVVTGVTLNALTGGAAPAVTVSTGGSALVASGGDGAFSVPFTTSGNNRISLTGAGFIERQTGIQAPSLDLRLSLIPSTFESSLTHFNQMFRHTSTGILARWTSAPHLVIERRVLQFTDVSASSYTALTDTLTEANVSSLTVDLTDGLAALTDGKLGAFASISAQTTDPGAPVSVSNEGRIVVTRVLGLTSATGFWGYARWSTTPDGQVTRGFIMIDDGFERSSSPFKRSLRMHELGHALGYQHVIGIPSVMNSGAQIEPNTFDRNGARIAFLRPVGNRHPDIDPTGHAATTLSTGAPAHTWHGAR